ncbi:glycosyltransferase [Paenibacillus sp. KQZ6P-2]|uniref:Glycosyltransferase n=1 Tax=Paenibacillus mangrovi TaxID=2931978 RepID=A0A9X1WR55_9BACL|nr:glycosyltransferase [Paenibacillus mangrovi]MCJ8013523.1 glycosyltransferase [Paenibacillus mangrovi]
MKDKTRVSGFLDPFSLECFRDLCDLHQIDLKSWRQHIADVQPDILLVVSASKDWKSNKNKLLRILEHCKNNGMETVFISVNHKISDRIKEVSTRIYDLPMNYKTVQQDPSAISLYKKRVQQFIGRQLAEQKENEAVSVITCTKREHLIENVFANYIRQEWAAKELIIILNNNEMDISKWKEKAATYEGITVYQVPEDQNLGACLNFGVSRAKYDYIAKLDDDDYYAPFYLTDMMHAFGESDADIVGKRAFFIYFERKKCLALKYPDRQNRYVSHLAGATLVVKKNVFDHVTFRTDIVVGSDSLFLKDCREQGFRFFAADKFNYTCIRRPKFHEHTWKVKDKELLHKCLIMNCDGDYQSCVTI